MNIALPPRVRGVVLMSILFLALATAVFARVPRPDDWDFDSAGNARCLLDGNQTYWLYGHTIDMQGQGEVVRLNFPIDLSAPTEPWSISSIAWSLLGNASGGAPAANDFPSMTINGATFAAPNLQGYRFDGTFAIVYVPVNGIALTCSIFPCVKQRAVIEEWAIQNTGTTSVTFSATGATMTMGQPTDATGQQAICERIATTVASGQVAPGGTAACAIMYTLRRSADPGLNLDVSAEKAAQLAKYTEAKNTMVLQCPVPLLNNILTLAKIRTLESPIEASAGVVQTTGTSTYAPGFWANDNVEYAAPGAAFLNDSDLNRACNTMFRYWLAKVATQPRYIQGSYEQWNLHAAQGGRGDNSMMLHGLGRYLLGQGSADTAAVFWPLVVAAATMTEDSTDPNGVILSRTDELEGRYPTGPANLNTSSLAYDGYLACGRLAQALGHTAEAASYPARAASLATAIESYFGAMVQGYQTYKYYDTNTILRGWISMPVAMGIMTRKDATINALFSTYLWDLDTSNFHTSVKVASNDNSGVWPRETYYAVRAAFMAGHADTALAKTLVAARQGMLGPNGPFMDEDPGDLLAPNVLYMRVIPEGLFGLIPMALDSFNCTPHMPTAWPSMDLTNVFMTGRYVDLHVARSGQNITLKVNRAGTNTVIFSGSGADGITFGVNLNAVTPTKRASQATAAPARFVLRGHSLIVPASERSQAMTIQIAGLDGRILNRMHIEKQPDRNSIDLDRMAGTAASAAIVVVKVVTSTGIHVLKTAW